jgi:uncharacterized protein (DUF433 family)
MTSTLCSDRITINPEVCFGKPCIRGLRLRVIDVLDNLAGGASPADLLRDYPYLEAEDIAACLAYASKAVAAKSERGAA